MIKKIFSLFAAILFAGSMWADEALLFSQTYPGSPSSYPNSYTGSYTLTTSGYTLTYANINNGTKASDNWTAVRAGRKNNASVASVTTGKISTAVSKVTITFTQVNADLTNELYLEVADNASFTSATKITQTIAQSEVAFTISSPAANQYYRIMIDQKSGSSNGFTRFSGVAFYYNDGGAPSTPTCATPTFSPAAGTYASAQNVTISCTTEDATIHYTIDGTEPTTSSPAYSSAIAVSTTTTIKAIAVKSGLDNSAVATAAYTILPVEHAGTESDPYTVADARNAIDVGGDLSNKYVAGIISQVDSYNEQYSSITYWISDDGTTTNQLEVYSGKGLNGADFSSVDDLKVNDEVTVKGTLKKFNSIYEFDKNSQLVSFNRPGGATPCATPTFSPAAGTYTSAQEVTISCETAGATIYYTTDGTTPTNESSVYSAAINVGEDMIIKAIAMKEGMENSFVATAAYVINIEDQSVKKTWDLSIDETASASEDELTWTATYVDMSFAKGTSSTAANNYYPGTSGQSYTSTRAYKNAVITITPKGGKQITTAVFTATTSGYATTLKNAAWTNATAVANDVTITVTASGSGAISAKLGGTTGFTSVTVNYKDASADPSISCTASLELAADDEEVHELAVTYSNFDDIEAHVAFYESDGETEATYAWFTADINSSNNVEYMAEANTSTEARTAYFKVYVGGVYSNLVTVTQAGVVVDYATLPFAFDGGKDAIASTNGLTHSGLGSDYASSPKLKFDGTGDYLILQINEDAGVLAFDIKGNSFSDGPFTVQTSEDGETYTDLKAYTELDNSNAQTEIFKLEVGVRYIKWIYTYKGQNKGNVGLGNISVSKDTYSIAWSLGDGPEENLGVLGKKGDSDSYAKYFDKEILHAGTYNYNVKLYKNGVATLTTTTLPINQEKATKYYVQFDYNASTGVFTASASNPRTPTSVDNTDATKKAVKFIENGQLFIELNGHIYNVQGQTVK